MANLLDLMGELREWSDLIGLIIGVPIFIIFLVLIIWIKLSERLRRRK